MIDFGIGFVVGILVLIPWAIGVYVIVGTMLQINRARSAIRESETSKAVHAMNLEFVDKLRRTYPQRKRELASITGGKPSAADRRFKPMWPRPDDPPGDGPKAA